MQTINSAYGLVKISYNRLEFYYMHNTEIMETEAISEETAQRYQATDSRSYTNSK